MGGNRLDRWWVLSEMLALKQSLRMLKFLVLGAQFGQFQLEGHDALHRYITVGPLLMTLHVPTMAHAAPRGGIGRASI